MQKILFLFGLFLSLVTAASAAPNAPSDGTYRARIDAISEGQTAIVVTKTPPREPAKNWKTFTLSVTDSNLKAKLKNNFEPGDLVSLTASGGVLTEIEIRKVAVSFLSELITLIIVALVLWVLAWLAVRGTGYRISRFIVGQDNRYSKSKFQIAIWFATVIVTYLATVYLRWSGSVPSLIGGVEIPENLLLLSGISALSFATAKGITQGKANRSAAVGVQVKSPDNVPSFPSDLVTDDSNQPDLGDFQMVIITLVAVGVYFVQIFDFLSLLQLKAQVSLPDVDSTLLGIFGISHGAYLTKKAVSGDEGSAAAAPVSPVAPGSAEAAAAPSAAARPPVAQKGPV